MFQLKKIPLDVLEKYENVNKGWKTNFRVNISMKQILSSR